MIRRLIWNLVLVSAFSNVCAAANPKYREPTRPLSTDHEYFRSSAAPDYWALIGHYRGQETGSSCGVASAIMVLNALRARASDIGSEFEFLRQGLGRPKEDKFSFFNVTRNLKWKTATSPGGSGTNLSELQGHLQKAIVDLKINASVRKVGGRSASEPGVSPNELRNLLLENEGSANHFIIANFDQAILTGEYVSGASYGHIAPVAAFDAKTGRVLILDPDRDFYEPYWASFEAFVTAVNSIDKGAKTHRGLLWVEAKKP